MFIAWYSQVLAFFLLWIVLLELVTETIAEAEADPSPGSSGGQ
jgi:hypothetical protein